MNLRHDLARLLRGIADRIDPPLVVVSMPLEEFMALTVAERIGEIARSN